MRIVVCRIRQALIQWSMLFGVNRRHSHRYIWRRSHKQWWVRQHRNIYKLVMVMQGTQATDEKVCSAHRPTVAPKFNEALLVSVYKTYFRFYLLPSLPLRAQHTQRHAQHTHILQRTRFKFQSSTRPCISLSLSTPHLPSSTSPSTTSECVIVYENGKIILPLSECIPRSFGRIYYHLWTDGRIEIIIMIIIIVVTLCIMYILYLCGIRSQFNAI